MQSGYQRLLFMYCNMPSVVEIALELISYARCVSIMLTSSSTNANKGTSISLPSPTLFGGKLTGRGRELLENEISANSDFAGSADSSQSNRLNGSVAVTVDRILENGNLWIRGQKLLTLNQGSEIVRVVGQIRPQDITPSNTILSSQIADASITYGGSGLLADSNRAGWLTRILNGPLWPF